MHRNAGRAHGAGMGLHEFGLAFKRILDGDLTPFGGPVIDQAIAGRLRAAQIAIVARFTPAMMLANVLNAGILMAAFWGTPQHGFAIGWGFTVITFSAYIYLRRRYAPVYQKGRTASRRAIRRAMFNAMCLGVMWALLPLLLFPNAGPNGQIIIVALSIGMMCGGALTLSAIPAAGLSYLAPLVITSAIALVWNGEMVYRLVIGLLIVYAAVLMRAMFIYAGQTAVRFIAEIEHEQAARTDALTQLPNRLAFNDRLD